MSRLQITKLVILALVISSVYTTAAPVVSPYGAAETNPFCSSTLSMNPTNLKAGGSSGIDFDYTSTYYNSDGDSAPLFIASGDGMLSEWRFSTTNDNQFTNSVIKACVGTTTASYHFHMNQFLFLKDGNTYKFCGFSPSSPFGIVYTLTAPTGTLTGPITKFMPFYFNKNTGIFFVAVSDGTDTAIYSYNPVGTNQAITPTLYGTKLNQALTSIHGNQEMIYSHLTNQILYINPPIGGSAWSNVGTTIPAGNTIASYLLRDGCVILATLGSNKLTGSIHRLQLNPATVVTDIAYTDTTTTAFRDFSDDCSNFVRVGTTSMIWIHQRESPTSFLKSIYTIAELTASNYGTVINDVALSGDKAVLLTDTTILYLKHIADNSIKAVLSTPISSLTLTGEYQYILKLSCLCKQVKRFACFSSTLNCIIVKKGSDSCLNTDIFSD